MNPNPIVSRLSHQIALVILSLVLGLTCATASAASIQATPAPTTSADPDFAAIDEFIEKEMQAQRIPGLAVGIVHGDQIVHLKGFGIADPSGRAVTPQTPFLIFSSTKSFTALAIMQLVEAGKIELDAPVQRYLPWFRVADENASAHITVRHLLNQTSGLPDTADVGLLSNTDTSASAMEQRVRGLTAVSLGPSGRRNVCVRERQLRDIGVDCTSRLRANVRNLYPGPCLCPAGHAPVLHCQNSRPTARSSDGLPLLVRPALPSRLALQPEHPARWWPVLQRGRYGALSDRPAQ